MSELASDLGALALGLSEQPDVDEMLVAIAAAAVELLDCDAAGVCLIRGREIESCAATDPAVEHADKLQGELGEGPGLQAVQTQATFVVHDLAADSRWPRYGPAVAQLGLRSLVSLRLHTFQLSLGALTLYSTRVRDWSRPDLAAAHALGAHASVALAAARRESGLRHAVEARHLIGLAQGILMQQFGLSDENAFAVLRRYSQHHNVKLRTVAESVIETRTLPGGTLPGPSSG